MSEMSNHPSNRLVRSRGGLLVLLLLSTVLAAFALPLIGRTCYSPALYFPSLVTGMETGSRVLILQERFINTLLAMIAGSGLALAGLALQTLFRNPLASPYTLGIASGASFGATLWIFFLPAVIRLAGKLESAGVGNFLEKTVGVGMSFGAFGGAVLATGIVFLLARRRNLSSERILLAGIAVCFFFSSLILLFQYLSDEGRSFQMIRWTMGEISAVDSSFLTPMGTVVALGAILLFLFAREMDILLTGEERALSLGMNLTFFRFFLFFLSSILVAVIVSICGPIGFVGLMVPHFCRLLIGIDHRYLVPATALFGAIFLSVCFTFARSILYLEILPVGVVTSLLGGPFFLALLLQKR